MTNKTLSVAAIRNGTVIDHIVTGGALKIIRFLRLEENQKKMTVGLNLKSQLMGLKDIIKIENFFLSVLDISQIAVFASKATVTVINNYSIANKCVVQMPEEIIGIFVCPNPRCVTNHESLETSFAVMQNDQSIALHCYFCEKLFSRNEVREKLH